MMGTEKMLAVYIDKNDQVTFGEYGLNNQDTLEIALTLIVNVDAKMRKAGVKPGRVRGEMLKELQQEERYEERVAVMMVELDAGS